MEDIEDKNVTTCEKNDTTDSPQRQSIGSLKQKIKRIRE